MRDYTKFELSEVLVSTLGTANPRLKIIEREANVRGKLLTEIIGLRELINDRNSLCAAYYKDKDSPEARNYLASQEILHQIPVQLRDVQEQARGKSILPYDPNRVLI